MNRLLKITGFLFLLCFSLQSKAQSKPQFNHLTVYVTDLERATEFYKYAMMLDTIPEPFHDHRHSWFRIGAHSQLHVVSGAKEDVPHDVNIHLAFTVASLPDFIKHLEKLGIKYGNFGGEVNKIALRPDQVQQIYLQDPDGYWIEVNNDRF
ncbi:MAG TPA: VOC family protein [Puia sp.]|jgi:lactoylglutathione lyase|nr:VOC family protein [Puia sp.]